MTSFTVASVDTFIVTLPRDVPYLGPLGSSETVNARGYIVRQGNATIYPTVDRSVVVRIRSTDGRDGWGETYGICAPRATCEIINDLLAPVLVGHSVGDVGAIWDMLYGLMRVRGSWSGFYTDALAAIDIALWDILAQNAGMPLAEALGPLERCEVPAYLSGLPAADLAERVEIAKAWQAHGQTAFKVHAVVSHESIVAEVGALRAALGENAKIMVDLHWKFTPEQAILLIDEIARYHPFFVEAPVAPEDAEGLARVRAAVTVPIAAGEEWPTLQIADPRMANGCVDIVQPEMGHCGVTQFVRIAEAADRYGITLAPHATIGTGIFLAASLHASRVAKRLWRHEWQHSIFEANLALLDTDMCHADGAYLAPTGPGLGVRPKARFWSYAEAVAAS
jgi:L-alanine-DL-glutamate epimerase-like enolase superfamily enzyme